MGIDIKGARIWRGAKTAHEKGIKNVAFVRTFINLIESIFAEGEVDEIWHLCALRPVSLPANSNDQFPFCRQNN